MANQNNPAEPLEGVINSGNDAVGGAVDTGQQINDSMIDSTQNVADTGMDAVTDSVNEFGNTFTEGALYNGGGTESTKELLKMVDDLTKMVGDISGTITGGLEGIGKGAVDSTFEFSKKASDTTGDVVKGASSSITDSADGAVSSVGDVAGGAGDLLGGGESLLGGGDGGGMSMMSSPSGGDGGGMSMMSSLSGGDSMSSITEMFKGDSSFGDFGNVADGANSSMIEEIASNPEMLAAAL